MGIHPIDLQTMYSQMGNVSRNLSAMQEASRQATQIRENEATQQNIQRAESVQKAAQDETKTATVNPDSKNSHGRQNSNSQKNEEQKSQESLEAKNENLFCAPNLGKHIDISG